MFFYSINRYSKKLKQKSITEIIKEQETDTLYKKDWWRAASLNYLKLKYRIDILIKNI